MRHVKSPLVAVAMSVALAAALAGCGSSSAPKVSPSGILVNHSATSPGQIILSDLGAARIGVRTVAAHSAPAGQAREVVIPYSAVIYDPSGKTYAFTNTRPLTYVEVPITIDRIAGDSVYLSRGPRAGDKVVTVGAEELYGVQTGVLAQT